MNTSPERRAPLRFSRELLVSSEEAERIHELGKRILHEMGLEVRNGKALQRLRAEGFRVDGDRVHFEPAVVEEHVSEMRRYLASQPRPAPRLDDGRFYLSASTYGLYVHDIDSDRMVPYTTERLVDMCKLVDTLADEDVSGAPPGIPQDEHPDMQQIVQFRVAALNARQQPIFVEPTSAKTVNHLLDMVEVMGRPVDHLKVYLPTPLRLGGESLEVVMACLERLSSIGVSSMPSVGATAPIHPFGALALGAAELLGGLVAMRALTGKPVTFRVSIWPFDLRVGAMVLGSPEHMLYLMLRGDVNTYYGQPWSPATGSIFVTAKRPDAQAAAERASTLAVGAILGARSFGGAGSLGLDEIFSPEQLLIDCDIRDWAQRGTQGIWLGEEAVDDWMEVIRAGVKRGFMGLDSTLDNYRQQVWYPRRFQRDAASAWMSRGQPHLSDEIRDEIRRRIASHEYELDSERRRQIQRICQSAQAMVNA